ncbi:riboflavin synthase [Candidatus Sumerlaeota bacterium]|nr:riboflavin synthase [Candidatus Sumerlaeota bacterium]
MFTGLIEAIGTLASRTGRGEGQALIIEAPSIAPSLSAGESVAVDGCCLTVVRPGTDDFEVFASPETLSRATLADRPLGAEVNLERALALGDRLGGHLVTGHVDARGTVERYKPAGESWTLTVSFPPDLAHLVVEKGSIAVDGISLTTFDVAGDRFSVAVIPETHTRTTLHLRRAGDAVNLECDLIGKYVARHLALAGAQTGLTEEMLLRAGFQGGRG